MNKYHYQHLEYKKIISIFEKKDRNATILDYGSGCGRYSLSLYDLGFNVIASDINHNNLQKIAEYGVEILTPKEVELKSDKYDYILLSHLVEHLTPNELYLLITTLINKLKDSGEIFIVSPLPGDRFWHDCTHIRPYLPQSVRHGFGSQNDSLSLDQINILEMKDIYFFSDPYKTRLLKSYYFPKGVTGKIILLYNKLLDLLWFYSNGIIGRRSSWLGIYRKKE